MAGTRKGLISVGIVGALGLAAFVVAQVPTSMREAPMDAPQVTIGSDTLHFQTRVGSFKLLGSDAAPVKGTLAFDFNGTVLVSGDKPAVTVSGNVRKEYKNEKFGKTAYFGRGHIVITGDVHTVQFFGTDVNGQFKGQGIMRMYGEFDDKLDTGTFHFGNDKPQPWGTSGMQMAVPQQIRGARSADVKVKDN